MIRCLLSWIITQSTIQYRLALGWHEVCIADCVVGHWRWNIPLQNRRRCTSLPGHPFYCEMQGSHRWAANREDSRKTLQNPRQNFECPDRFRHFDVLVIVPVVLHHEILNDKKIYKIVWTSNAGWSRPIWGLKCSCSSLRKFRATHSSLLPDWQLWTLTRSGLSPFLSRHSGDVPNKSVRLIGIRLYSEVPTFKTSSGHISCKRNSPIKKSKNLCCTTGKTF